ncbi:hypothetical protein EPUS_03179 [Endocarpon pusillum Z07020]|uniref:LysM domain-containing protein n=1 Tax=Endocarpon pusillum (strain Z07020 / HMAS-L-300199) TaxID=1263415 RepID=U1HVQ7_ENDPU|nr:uncharacterized protein EPUS_03179 [Endocarpon pusillum Z07020]ERF74795.1 hypothetical protein EPUS_03179 [Endocarpon pusillum Z07020]
MNPDGSTYTSTSPKDCSIRPRNNRRLISFDDHDGSTLQDAGSSAPWSQPKFTSPFPSRGVSPIPGAHPSRPLPAAADPRSIAPSNYDSGKTGRGQTSAASGLGLWESWSSIQSIASTLLGSDAQQPPKGKGGGTFNASVRRKFGNASGVGATTPQWGPETSTGQTHIAGSKEERQAMVQAKKRETLLLADANGLSGLYTPHKRRDSNLRLPDTATPAEYDGDALVYVHKVKPQDTLAGVMIRYQCQPAVFRKVNRLWPNDNIQIRDHVFLPVEACAIRGRRIDTKESVPDHNIPTCVGPNQSKNNSNNHFHLPADDTSPSLTPNTNSDLDPEYKHEYFVSLPNIPESIEIARIPRRTLGFFPPSRRKSQTLSDLDPYSDTPKTSLDMNSRLNSLSLSTSPSRNRPNRSQRSNSRSNTSSYWADRLKGPGGVGPLRSSGPGLAGPGPAEDSLNKMFAHHLPNVAPRESFDSVRSTGSSATAGLENVGGVIEGWVRKVGSKITGNPEPEEVYRRLGGGAGSGGRNGMGDLIELEDSSGDTVMEEHHMGVLGASTCASVPAFDGPASRPGSGWNSRDLLTLKGKGSAGVGVTASATASAIEEEALLRERFPPRGRMVDAQTNVSSRRR